MEPFDRVVRNFFDKYAGTSTLIIENESSAYDPSNPAAYDNAPVEYTVRTMVFDYLPKKDGDTSIRNTVIAEGDKQLFIQPAEKVNGTAFPKIQPNRDRVKVGDKTYKIVTYKEYNPSGSDRMLIECFIRG